MYVLENKESDDYDKDNDKNKEARAWMRDIISDIAQM
jgi:hypothetical protein